MSSNQLQMLAILETPAGGEESASRELLSVLHLSLVIVEIKTVPSLGESSLFAIFRYIVCNAFASIRICFQFSHSSVIYVNSYTTCLGAIVAAFFSQQKVVFHYHGSRIPTDPDGSLTFVKRYVQLFKRNSIIWLHGLCFRYIRLCFIPTQEIKKELIQCWPILKKKSVILENGYNQKKFYPVSPNKKILLRKKYNVNQYALVISTVGRIDPEKDIIKSIQIVEQLQQMIGNKICYVIAFSANGIDRAYLNECTTYLRNSTLPIRMIRDSAAINELYQISDITLSCSKREVFPLVLLESFACGVPFTATENGATEHLLEQIDHRLVLSNDLTVAAKQLKKCLHPQQHHSYSKKGISFVKGKNWKEIRKLFAKAIQTIN